MEYRITWVDNGEAKSIDVSSAHAVKSVVMTLQQNPSRYSDIEATASRGIRQLTIRFSE